jgi:hypothetical protein
MRGLAAVAAIALAIIGLAGCDSSTPIASQGKVTCPTSDQYSCYYSGTNTPVRGPRTIDGYQVVGRLPKYCTQKSQRCSAGDAIAMFYFSGSPAGSHPTGEYLEWTIRDGGRAKKLATYIPKAEMETGNFGQLPKG